MGNSPPLPAVDLPLTVRELGMQDYQHTWDDMRRFNDRRHHDTGDEIWLVEHPPVFTLGLNGKAEHVIDAHDIPVIQCDRGGQVTYHGPGQLVAYVMVDLQRRKWGVKKLVNQLEEAVIGTLQKFSISGQRRTGAPGVYVDNAKIAALGLRVRRGCSYHGLSLNVDMDLSPFTYINPCGFEGLAATQIKDLRPDVDIKNVKRRLIAHLTRQLTPAEP